MASNVGMRMVGRARRVAGFSSPLVMRRTGGPPALDEVISRALRPYELVDALSYEGPSPHAWVGGECLRASDDLWLLESW